MPGSFIHYRSYYRGWRPLCGVPYVPETVRGTLAVKDVTCPKCLEAMEAEMSRSGVERGGGEAATPISPAHEPMDRCT
jgi:hypothetical protein